MHADPCALVATRHGDAGWLVRAESLLDPLVGHPVLFPEAAERGDELIDRPLRHGLIPALEGSHLLGEAEEALHGLTLGRGPPPGIQGLQVLADGLQGLDDPTELLAVAGDPVDDALLRSAGGVRPSRVAPIVWRSPDARDGSGNGASAGT